MTSRYLHHNSNLLQYHQKRQTLDFWQMNWHHCQGSSYNVVWLLAMRQTFIALVKESWFLSSSMMEIKLFHLDICITYASSVSLSPGNCDEWCQLLHAYTGHNTVTVQPSCLGPALPWTHPNSTKTFQSHVYNTYRLWTVLLRWYASLFLFPKTIGFSVPISRL